MNDKMKTKVNPVLISQLQSGVENKVMLALEELRESGNAGYLPSLIELLLLTEYEAVRTNIMKVLNDLKELQSRPVLIEAIENDKYLSIRKELVTSCWQNGLDFSEYAPIFVSLVINSEFETAFEAFTVIDSFEFLPASDIREKEIIRIDRALESATDSKKYLLQELKNTLAVE